MNESFRLGLPTWKEEVVFWVFCHWSVGSLHSYTTKSTRCHSYTFISIWRDQKEVRASKLQWLRKSQLSEAYVLYFPAPPQYYLIFAHILEKEMSVCARATNPSRWAHDQPLPISLFRTLRCYCLEASFSCSLPLLYTFVFPPELPDTTRGGYSEVQIFRKKVRILGSKDSDVLREIFQPWFWLVLKLLVGVVIFPLRLFCTYKVGCNTYLAWWIHRG